MRAIQRLGRSFLVNDDQQTFWDRFESGSWEPETLAWLDQFLSPQSTFIDIGAWVGPTSLWAAFTARHVLAIEADPAALDQLACNLAANPVLALRIDVIPSALHGAPGKVTMTARRKPGDSMSSVLPAGGVAKAVWQADVITPAALAERLVWTEDLVVKMDIEGAEYALLPEMASLIGKARAVLVSCHPGLARTALGWDTARIEQAESEVFGLFTDYERYLISPLRTGASTAEWAFIRV